MDLAKLKMAGLRDTGKIRNAFHFIEEQFKQSNVLQWNKYDNFCETVCI